MHFDGCCQEAIGLYERVFEIEADAVYLSADKKLVEHSEMHIHGQRVMLNDQSDVTYVKSGTAAVRLLIMFRTQESLMKSFNVMKEDGITLMYPPSVTDYSPLVTDFADKFGIQWIFMVDENTREF